MIISHKYKFIFFSNPKTGSESVREILSQFAEEEIVSFTHVNINQPFYSHMPPVEVKKVFESKGLNYNEYYKFVFTRNPFEKLVSLYEMIYRHDSQRDLNQIKKAFFRKEIFGVTKYFLIGIVNLFNKKPLGKPSFKDWLRSTEVSGKGAADESMEFKARQFGTYTIDNFTRDKNGLVLVDEIIRLEDIEEELPRILEKISPEFSDISVIKKNVRPRNKLISEYYDTETIELVRTRYHGELTKFNYDISNF